MKSGDTGASEGFVVCGDRLASPCVLHVAGCDHDIACVDGDGDGDGDGDVCSNLSA